MTASSPSPTSISFAEIPRKEPRPGLVLATIVTCQLMLVLDATIVNIALPKIQGGLHFSSTNLSWVVNAYILTFGGLLLLGGRAGDILGRKRMFIGGIVLFTVASFLGGIATNAGLLLASRALQGVGAAAAGPSMLALIVTNFAEGTPRTKALSIFSAMSSAGGSVGLLLGGMLTSWGSWRLVMFVNVPIGVVVVLFANKLLRESTRQPGRFDLAGALTSILGMGSLVYAFITAGDKGWGDAETIGMFAAAVVLLTSFVFIETRAAHPVIPLRLLKDGPRARGYICFLLLPAAMFGMFFFVSQFMQDVLGFSPVKAGMAFLPLTLVLFGVSRMVPKLLPRFGVRKLLVPGTLLVAGGLLWLSRVTPDTPYLSGIAIPLVMFGLGAGLAFGPLSVTILSGLRPQDSGAAGGMLQASQQTGGALGLSVLVSVFSSVSRSGSHVTSGAPAAIAADAQQHFTHGLGTALLVAAVFAFAAVLIASTLKPRAAAPAGMSGSGGNVDSQASVPAAAIPVEV